MAHGIHFVDADICGWRRRVRIVERPSGNSLWEVLSIAPDESMLLVRRGAEVRTYLIRERVDNDFWRGTLESVTTV